MKTFNRHAKRTLISEINITPLTDVALVLLIIFMVATPLIVQTGISVKLPKTTNAESQPANPITVSISEHEKIFLGDHVISKSDLEDSLKVKLTQAMDKTVLVRADRNVMHGLVVDVLDIAKSAGAQRLGIATENRKQ